MAARPLTVNLSADGTAKVLVAQGPEKRPLPPDQSPAGLTKQEAIDRAIEGTASPGEFMIMPRRIWTAAVEDDLQTVQAWCDACDGPSWPNKDAPTIMPSGPHRVSFLIHAAILAGSDKTDVLRHLVGRRIRLDREDNAGLTPLEFAVTEGNHIAVYLLFAAGARLRELSWWDDTFDGENRGAAWWGIPFHKRKPLLIAPLIRAHYGRKRLVSGPRILFCMLMGLTVVGHKMQNGGVLLAYMVLAFVFEWHTTSMMLLTVAVQPLLLEDYYAMDRYVFGSIWFARCLWLLGPWWTLDWCGGDVPPHWCPVMPCEGEPWYSWPIYLVYTIWDIFGTIAHFAFPAITMLYGTMVAAMLADFVMIFVAWIGKTPLRLYMTVFPYLLDVDREWGTTVTLLPSFVVAQVTSSIGWAATALVFISCQSSKGEERLEVVGVVANAWWLLSVWLSARPLDWADFALQILVLALFGVSVHNFLAKRLLIGTDWWEKYEVQAVILTYLLGSVLVFPRWLSMIFMGIGFIKTSTAILEAADPALMMLLVRAESAMVALMSSSALADCRRIATSAASACVSAVVAAPSALLAWHKARRELAANQAMGELTSAEEERNKKAAQRKDKEEKRRRAAEAAAAAAATQAEVEVAEATAAAAKTKEGKKAADRAKAKAKREEAAKAKAREEEARQQAAAEAAAAAAAARRSTREAAAAAQEAEEAEEEAAAEVTAAQALRRRRLERAAHAEATAAQSPPPLTGVPHAAEAAAAAPPEPPGGPLAAAAAAPPEPPSVPDEFCCPLTHDIMHDPVQTVDGLAYERTAIAEWLARSQTSPLTGAPLPSTLLIDCVPLRGQIRRFLELHPELAPPPPRLVPSAASINSCVRAAAPLR